MSHALPEPTEAEMASAKVPHDVFLSNLIGNHILTFTAISTFGQAYMKYMVLVPILSFIALGYTYYRSTKVKQADSPFVWAHWQIARRWSKLFSIMLLLLCSVTLFAWLGHTYLGMMKELVYAFVGGLGILPTLVSVLILIVIESDSLHHARMGTLPKWAQRRYFNVVDESPAGY
jgi:fumarate reductase subunit D